MHNKSYCSQMFVESHHM